MAQVIYNDDQFRDIATQKGGIVKFVKDSAEAAGWMWMVTDEGPDYLVIELRRVKS